MDFDTYGTASLAKGDTATDIGYWIHLFEIMSSGLLVTFNVFEFCYTNLFLITLGQITNSSSIAGNFVTDLATVGIETCTGAGPYFQLWGSLYDGSTDEEVGALFATVFTDIFNFEVPTFKVN